MSEVAAVRRNCIRWTMLATACLAALALLWLWQPNTTPSKYGAIGSEDFIAYWSAARLALQGGNPYDPSALLAVEQTVGWSKTEPWRVWNPPWTLAWLLPLAFLPFGLATLIWISLQVALILGSGIALWHYFAPGDRRYWIGLALAATFGPALYSVGVGQLGGLLVAGVVAFLWAERRHWDLLAGGALALLMIKPQVTYLFWLAALWWAWSTRRRGILAGWLAVLAGTCGVVVLLADSVLAGYLGSLAAPPFAWATTTLGAWLRIFFGIDQRWLQVLPSVVGLLALTVWTLRRPRPWSWEQVTPGLLLASSLTTAYGGIVDQAVLLPVVVALVVRLRAASRARHVATLGALVLCQLGLVVARFHHVQEALYVGNVLVLDALYWWGVPVLAVAYGWSAARADQNG